MIPDLNHVKAYWKPTDTEPYRGPVFYEMGISAPPGTDAERVRREFEEIRRVCRNRVDDIQEVDDGLGPILLVDVSRRETVGQIAAVLGKTTLELEVYAYPDPG